MMQYLVLTLFIIEFLLVLLIFVYILLKKGLTFKGGMAFGLLFFVFIPLWVLIITGSIPLSKADFGWTKIVDIILKKEIGSSFILIGYIFSIIVYLYFPAKSFTVNKHKVIFRPSIKYYFLIYIVCMIIIFLGSGLLEGGNWYANRHIFLESTGAFAVLVAFILNSSKILIIASIIQKWMNKKIGFYKFLIFIVGFTVLDMVFSGNRIYLFCTAIIIGVIFLKRFPKKVLISMPLMLPLVFFLGYFASIFRHMRGPLFAKGFPTFEVFVSSLNRAMELDPIKPKQFFLNISESVNVNVIYEVFNNYDNLLYGATYIKQLVFYVPRSFWEGKPESITVIAADFLGGASLVTTIIGEMHMNFSFLGIFFLPFFLWGTDSLLSYGVKNYPTISGVILFFFGILFFRMPYSDEFLVFVFLVLILVFFNFFNRYKITFRSYNSN